MPNIAGFLGGLAGKAAPTAGRVAGFIGRHEFAASTIGGAGLGFITSGGELSGALVGAGVGWAGARVGHTLGSVNMGKVEAKYAGATKELGAIRKQALIGESHLGPMATAAKVRRQLNTEFGAFKKKMSTRAALHGKLPTDRQFQMGAELRSLSNRAGKVYGQMAEYTASMHMARQGRSQRRLGGALIGGAVGGIGVAAISAVGSSFGNRSRRSPHGTTFSGMGNGTVLGY